MTKRDGDGEDDRALRARLDKLSGALKAQRRDAGSAPTDRGGDSPDGGFGSAASLGLRAASEFAAAVVVGTLIGWGLDRLLGTKPAFLIVFFLLGVVSGIWNVIRVTSPLSRARTPVKDVPNNELPKAPAGDDEDGD